jgi:hypothetical protein
METGIGRGEAARITGAAVLIALIGEIAGGAFFISVAFQWGSEPSIWAVFAAFFLPLALTFAVLLGVVCRALTPHLDTCWGWSALLAAAMMLLPLAVMLTGLIVYRVLPSALGLGAYPFGATAFAGYAVLWAAALRRISALPVSLPAEAG